jgi:RNA polymerase sigma-70 factor (ECF subfamily)
MPARAAFAQPPSEPDPGEAIRGLVASAQQGDRAAFEALYARFSRAIHGILLSRVPRAEVEDLVQDVFMTALEQLPALREPAAFAGWLATIARHRAADYLRRSPATTTLPADLAASAGDRADAMLVMAAIRNLPDAYRETLTLRLVEGMTGPEIAACTGLTEGSVRVNLHRGMRQLRERLERNSS